MKQRTQFSLIAAGLMAAGLMASGWAVGAGDSATEEAAAKAHVYTPIALDSSVDLNFGNVVALEGGGTVVLSAASTAVRTPSAVGLVPANAGTVTAAKFTVTGESGVAFSISLPDNDDVVIKTGTGDTDAKKMAVTDFTVSLPALSAQTLTSGTVDFYVGATLAVAAEQVAGDYTGDFSVTVTYD